MLKTVVILIIFFDTKLFNEIESEIIDECMNAHPEDFSTLCEVDYVDFEGINGFNAFDLQDFTASEDGTVTITGVVYVSVEIGIYSYNWSYERDEDDSRYICVGSGEVQMHYAFDLTVSKDGERENLQLC